MAALKLKTKDRRTGKTKTLNGDQAVEMFVGGVSGLLALADGLALPASTGAALMMVLDGALPKLAKVSMKGVVAAYNNIGGDLPPEAGAKLLAATARPKGRRRR